MRLCMQTQILIYWFHFIVQILVRTIITTCLFEISFFHVRPPDESFLNLPKIKPLALEKPLFWLFWIFDRVENCTTKFNMLWFYTVTFLSVYPYIWPFYTVFLVYEFFRLTRYILLKFSSLPTSSRNGGRKSR